MPSVSQAQRRAMGAAASGHSNLGIPKSVGKEFIDKDTGGKLPARAKKDATAAVYTAQYPNIPKDRSMTKLDDCMNRMDALSRRFDDMCERTEFGKKDDDCGRDDDGSMSFPARRRSDGEFADPIGHHGWKEHHSDKRINTFTHSSHSGHHLEVTNKGHWVHTGPKGYVEPAIAKGSGGANGASLKNHLDEFHGSKSPGRIYEPSRRRSDEMRSDDPITAAGARKGARALAGKGMADAETRGPKVEQPAQRPQTPKYNAEAVNKSIAQSERRGGKVSGKERSAIHRLLKGRYDDDDLARDRRDDFNFTTAQKPVHQKLISGGFTHVKEHEPDDKGSTHEYHNKKEITFLNPSGSRMSYHKTSGRFLGTNTPISSNIQGKRSRIDDRVVTEVLARDRRRDASMSEEQYNPRQADRRR